MNVHIGGAGASRWRWAAKILCRVSPQASDTRLFLLNSDAAAYSNYSALPSCGLLAPESGRTPALRVNGMLTGMSVLIVEQAGLVSLDLAMVIEDLHGCPIPVSSVAQGLEVVATRSVSAAILGGHLPDGEVTPLAVALTELRIPFIVHTGGELSSELSTLFPHLSVVSKPASSDAVVAALEHECLNDDVRTQNGQFPGRTSAD